MGIPDRMSPTLYLSIEEFEYECFYGLESKRTKSVWRYM